MANKLLGSIEEKIVSGLEECKVAINDVKDKVGKPRKAYYNSQGEPYSLEDYQTDLKVMRSQIQEQKVWVFSIRSNSNVSSRYDCRRHNSSWSG